MKISTKGRYALRMMVDLAEHMDEGSIPLKKIAERQNISKKYLEQIIPTLNKPGILKTIRGNQGGYMLAKSPDQYTVGDILRLTEGSLTPVECLDNDPIGCDRRDYCSTLYVWKELDSVINEYLDSITLQNIIDQKKEQSANNYSI